MMFVRRHGGPSWYERHLEPGLRRWLVWWYGEGHAEQELFYRCEGCRRLISWSAIRQGGCVCGISHKISTTYVTRWERLKLIVTPWWGAVR